MGFLSGFNLNSDHRTTVDGLRAIAVFPVILFHAGSPLFVGGYLGVDIFFVISGYVIARTLLKDMAHERFSILRFYEKRARRLLPALILVVLASFIPAWLWMMPDQLKNFARSIVATAFFGSNFFFWWDADYFSESLHLKPLFHTWSLAVEEQFYVFFPLLLWVIYGKGRRMWLTLTLIGVASLCLAQLISTRFAAAGFYLFPTRAWELVVGALLAVAEQKFGGRPTTTTLSRVMPVVGMALIVGSIVQFNGATPHPGILTVAPVSGAALLIWYPGGRDPVSRLLASAPIVGLGLISYSLYLWHQPLFAFARLYSINEVEWPTYAALIALAVVLSYLSWRFVEQPFRKPGLVSPPTVWTASASALVSLIAVGYTGYAMNGFPGRRPPIEVAAGYLNSAGQDCFRHNCIVGDPVPPTIALVGDSHAAALATSLDRALKGSGKSALVLATGDVLVKSFPNFYYRADEWNDILSKQKAQIFEPQIETVILAGRFTLRIENTAFDNGEGGIEGLDATFVGRSEQEKQTFTQSIIDGIQDLEQRGKKIILVYPVPEVGWVVPATLQKMSMRQIRDGLTTSYDVYKTRNWRVFEIFDKFVSADGDIIAVRPDLVLCNTFVKDRCATNQASDVFYHDDDHLSVKGTDLVVRQLMDEVKARWGDFPSSGNREFVGALK
ncbi:hypothetical protein QV13_13380 [Mesorhizobium hungaricum]|uniref:Acyltransferase n=1 Tax=Mesorhizobium hungaricum TaxID=1566387 RepID=A0A1C2DSG4_9HYPH|nr:hypothetical protein QV13_13380 [Mesorhizobium hungaricum]